MDIFSDDTFVTSYPKSGNTWVRFFIANLLRDDGSIDLANLDQLVPDTAKVDPSAVAALPRPRFLKSHESYTPAYPRVLYLVRDVRAVVTSYYRQRLRMGVIARGLPMGDFVRMFIDGSVAQFGAWDTHVAAWINNSAAAGRRGAFCCVRYEDLLRNGPEAFSTIAKFLGVDRTEQQVQRAYQLSSFTRMRMLEDQAGRDWPEKRQARDLTIPFMYAGRADSWRQDLDEPSERLLAARFGPVLTALGYEI